MPFYIACVRFVIDYAAQVFHHTLPAYLSQELERVQTRAMRILCPGIEYQQGLEFTSLPKVTEHHHNICTRTFKCVMSDPNHKLRKLLRPVHKSNYNLRHARTFTLPCCEKNRFKDIFFWPQEELKIPFRSLIICMFLVLVDSYLTIRPVARKGYGSIAHEAKPNGLLTRGP